jgi:hypothetical protein
MTKEIKAGCHVRIVPAEGRTGPWTTAWWGLVKNGDIGRVTRILNYAQDRIVIYVEFRCEDGEYRVQPFDKCLVEFYSAPVTVDAARPQRRKLVL